MNHAPSFDKTLLGSTQSKVNADHWDQVTRWWDEKNYKEVVRGVIDYADPSLSGKYGNADKTSYSIPHGSVIVNVRITDTMFEVDAPFLYMPEGPKVPIMRQVAQLNFSPLNLAQIVKKGDQLTFQYACPLELCEPYKVYDVLREVCLNADTYDDEYMTKFGAKRIHQPQVTPHSQETLDLAWEKFQSYLKEANDYIQYFDSKRTYGFNWDVISITLRKIEYYASPQGYLRTEIERAINDLGSNLPFNDRIARGKEFLHKLGTITREKFDADMYITETFIPYKWRSVLENIKQNFQHANETSAKEISNNDHTGATLTIMFAFYNLFYNNNVQDDVAAVVENALREAAGKPWQEASSILRRALDKILSGDLSIQISKEVNPRQARTGIFSGLFGRK